MNLVIDIGNTLSKIAVIQQDMVVYFDKTSQLTKKDIDKVCNDAPPFDAVIVSSVKQFDNEVIESIPSLNHYLELSADTPIPVINKYATPGTLGKDRLAAAVGVNYLFPGTNLLVIDAGTCITYDFVNEHNEYLGGGISPGIEMRYKALHTFTGNLPLVEHTTINELVGGDTIHSILSGVQNGVVAEIDGIIAKYQEKFGNVKVILTGGNAEYFDKQLKNNIFAFPNLVLIGLNRILEFNR